MAGGSFALNKGDLKSAYIAIAIAVAGGLFYMWKQGKSANGAQNAVSNLLTTNTNSAASGSAGALSGNGTVNTYNVFPTVSSQSSTANGFYNGGHGNVGPSTVNGGTAWLSNGQGFSLPVKT